MCYDRADVGKDGSRKRGQLVWDQVTEAMKTETATAVVSGSLCQAEQTELLMLDVASHRLST